DDLGEWAGELVDDCKPRPSLPAGAGQVDLVSNEHDSPDRLSLATGNRRLFEQLAIELPDFVDAQLAELDQSGQSSLIVAVEGHFLGVIGVRDTIRESARDVLSEIQACGIEHLALLTGDREAPARQLTGELSGFQTIETALLPADKSSWIKSQIRAGRKVAMIGDGVNDAPALATATVGIALGGVGSDLAAEAGDLVLMGDPIRPLPGLLRLSRELVRTIRQSIYLFAFGMNGVGMVLGATGVLTPPVAAIFHELASLAVMLNALRLLWFERWDVTRLGQAARSVEAGFEWLAQTVSPTRLVFQFLAHWTTLVRLTFSGLALLWFLSNVVQIETGEQAVVTRFGRYEATLDAGLYWRWPAPFEEIHRERVYAIRSIEIGFRSHSAEAPGTRSTPVRPENNASTAPSVSQEAGYPAASVEWTSAHAGQSEDRVAEEALTLTGEEMPVELTAEVHFRIKDLREYVFASRDPASLLRAVAEGSLRELIAQLSLDGTLTVARREIEAHWRAKIAAETARYGMGVEITGVSLLDVHPPRQVVPSYRHVADVIELQTQLRNEAEAYYARTVLSAAGEEAIRILSSSVNGAAVAGEPTTGSVTDWSLSDALWQELITESDRIAMPLSGEAASRLMNARQQAARKTIAATGSAARINSLIPHFQQHPSLTGLQLYWQTVSKHLARQKLTVLDPGVTGRRHVLLLDPDRLSVPAVLQPVLPDQPAAPAHSKSGSLETGPNP
ncbi:MAG: HAD-IC family P-type ATPase, partial [Planctomycetaceae bacterium]